MRKELLKFLTSSAIVIVGLSIVGFACKDKTSKVTAEEKVKAKKLVSDVIESSSVEEYTKRRIEF